MNKFNWPNQAFCFICLTMSKCDILLIDLHIFAPIRTTKHNGNGKLINQTDNH